MSVIYCHENDDLIDTDFPNECEDCNRTECPYHPPDVDEQKTSVLVDIESEFVKGMVEAIGDMKKLKAEMLGTLESVLHDLNNMTTGEFSRGNDRPARDRLKYIIAKAKISR